MMNKSAHNLSFHRLQEVFRLQKKSGEATSRPSEKITFSLLATKKPGKSCQRPWAQRIATVLPVWIPPVGLFGRVQSKQGNARSQERRPAKAAPRAGASRNCW